MKKLLFLLALFFANTVVADAPPPALIPDAAQTDVAAQTDAGQTTPEQTKPRTPRKAPPRTVANQPASGKTKAETPPLSDESDSQPDPAILELVVATSLPSKEDINQKLGDKYFGNNPVLTPQEQEAVDIAKRWSAGTPSGIKPVAGPDGSVRYLFGAMQPSIVCAPLQICDVALQPGEVVNSVHYGDTARWTVEPAFTGSGDMVTQHLIIKPMDVGLETSLVVTTDRRTYHIRLRSHRTDYMPTVSFSYAEDAALKWKVAQEREKKVRQENTIPETGEFLGNLSFDYDIEGTVAWKPVRVYNDGRRTIIEMPKQMEQTEAPSLLVIRRDGGLMTDDEAVLVNYRVQGYRYIVDQVFNKAILVAGVGRTQDKVVITRRGQ